MIQFRTPRRLYGLAVGSFGLLVGCSTTTTVIGPPPELAQARAEYQSAAAGPAAQYAAADLREAKSTLDRAEAMYHSKPGSKAARSEAYLALHQLQVAEADANKSAAQAQREQSAHAALEAQRMAADEAELTRVRDELAQGGCGQEEQQGQQEHMAGQTGHPKQEDRMGQQGPCPGAGRADVAVIPEAAFFATGSAEISPAAKANLNEIARTIQRDHERRVRVEGFTDSTGTDEVNRPLSERRAEAVRDYLVSCGVSPTRIQTAGLGSSQQLGAEATPEGRAANRRVGITIEPTTGVAEPMP
jgi:outer membrane protein OmpA-like peptidoglycan-associated protein